MILFEFPSPQAQGWATSPTTLWNPVYTTCSHGFICAFAQGKCSSWARHLVTGLPVEQSRWHQALSPFAQWGKGSFASWWPLVLFTIWYFPNAKGLLQLWKIFSLTSNLTINGFFYCFVPPWGSSPAGVFHREGGLPSINLSGPGGITVQLISSEWTSFLWSYLQTVTWWWDSVNCLWFWVMWLAREQKNP